MDYIYGQMVKSMMVIGVTVNNMGKDYFINKMEIIDRENGKMVKELNG